MSSTFRKQFQRVRQNIDQNLGRAEKSEVLNEEEQNLERRVELLKNICTSLSKKLQLCLRNAGQGTDPEKRMKKIPESVLSHALIECSVQLEQQTPSGLIFLNCGDAEGRLAQEILQMEVDIENRVMKNIQTMLETDFPLIQKLKKQLNTRALDMDASKARYSSALKQAQSGASPQTKVEEIKNELEDNISKVDQTKDQLATEMYNFVSKEIEINQSLLDLVHVQASYHRQSLATLERIIPIMQESIDFASIKPVFSQRLDEHLELRAGRHISIVIEECVSALVEYGLEEEGLFRIAGSSSKIKKLKAAFNSNISCSNVISLDEDIDVHVIASILKLYLRELPEPLLCSHLYPEWMQCVREQNEEKRKAMLKEVIQKMPQSHQNHLRYMIRFLAKLAEYSDVNKMTPSNIGLVIGPNLLWPSGDQGPNMLATGMSSNLTENLINYALILFPGDIDFTYGAGRISHSFPVTSTNESGGYTILPALNTNPSDLSVPTKHTFLPAFSAPDLNAPTKHKDAPRDLPSEATSESYHSNTLKKASSKKHPAPSPPTFATPTTAPNIYPYPASASAISIPSNHSHIDTQESIKGSTNDIPSISSNIRPPIVSNAETPNVSSVNAIKPVRDSVVASKQNSSENIKSAPQPASETRTSFAATQDSLDVVVPYSLKVIEKPRIAPPERPVLPPPEKPKKPEVMEKHVCRSPKISADGPVIRDELVEVKNLGANPNRNSENGDAGRVLTLNRLHPASSEDTFLKTHNRQASTGSIQRPPRPLPLPKNRDSKTIE